MLAGNVSESGKVPIRRRLLAVEKDQVHTIGLYVEIEQA
jgi:hypothetical protein